MSEVTVDVPRERSDFLVDTLHGTGKRERPSVSQSERTDHISNALSSVRLTREHAKWSNCYHKNDIITSPQKTNILAIKLGGAGVVGKDMQANT